MKSFFLIIAMMTASCVTGGSGTESKPPASDPVAEALAEYSQHISAGRSKIKPEAQSLKEELQHRYEQDQYIRVYFMETPFQRKFTSDQVQAFRLGASQKWAEVDRENTSRMKILLKKEGGWFTISKHGAEVDNIAWILVQHADLDHVFQKEVLAMLEPLAEKGETDPSHYALLHDRVSVAEKLPQHYGTQGRCTGPGTWEPDKVLGTFEDVDKRRAKVGLKPLEEYKLTFKNICHQKDG